MDRREFLKGMLVSGMSLAIERPTPSLAEEYSRIINHLSKPMNLHEINERGFYIVALSNIAQGLLKMAIRQKKEIKDITQLLDETTKRAIKISPFNLSGPMKEEGYFLGNLNTILGIHREVTASKEYESTNTKISEYLAEQTIKDSQKHLRSFSKKPEKYPADQTTILYSLYLYDGNTGKGLHWQPVEEWLKFMKDYATDTKTGLHISEITGTKKGKYPRGCALSWEVAYLAKFKPSEGRKLWKKYKKEFEEDYLFAAGFREWPREVNFKADIDSGPIVRDIGAAATAVGILAAKEIGDSITYRKLKMTEKIGEIYVNWEGDEKIKKISNDLLAKAIQFNYNR